MATKTVGLTGRNYATMAAYSSYVNVLAFTAPEIVEVYNDGGPVADTTAVVLNGWTGGSPTNTLTVRAATGQSWKDNASVQTNAFRFNSANGAALTNNIIAQVGYTFGDNVIVQGLQIRLAANTPANTSQTLMVGANCAIRQCIVDNTGTYVLQTNGTDIVIENSLLHGRGTGSGLLINHASLTITNTTIVSSGGGSIAVKQPYAMSPATVAKNTVVFGFTTGFQNAADASSTNNATSLSAFGGTNWGTAGQVSVTAADFVNVTAGSEDFRISAGSKLRDTGVTTSVTVDAASTVRPQGAAYDIGAWEYYFPSTTINCTVGTASATGATASILGTTTISATVGNAAATGAPATVTNGVPTTTINATVGTAAATGSTAAVGTFVQTDNIPNNTGTILANTAVVWTWTPAGRIGSMAGLTATDGTGTTDANGRLAPGIALAAGRLDVADRSGSSGAKTDAVFYQAF